MLGTEKRAGEIDLILTEYIKGDYGQTSITQLVRARQSFIAVTHCDPLVRILPCVSFSER